MSSSTPMPALELKNIAHAFGDLQAVRDVTLSLKEGEVVCLLGPSGCGKTTVLRIAAGLEQLQQGTVSIAGSVVADQKRDLAPEERGVGLVFQDFALFPHLSVSDNVAFGLTGQDKVSEAQRVQESLCQVGMEAYLEAYPHMLSGGQQQRVALARALAPKPRIMLLDEPFSGLDATLRGQVRDDTLKVLKQSGAAAMMVTHDPEEAMFMADRIALMRGGKIIQMGEPTTLYCQPSEPFVANFFSDINKLSGIVDRGFVMTPFGRIAVDGFANDEAVQILIRPEALRLRQLHSNEKQSLGQVRVLSSRMLGRTSLVLVSSDDNAGSENHFHARVPGSFLPGKGEKLAVSLDLTQTFVFPGKEAV
ncbi:MAG: ABC transporter ATP-binding protein [Pseudomonadota bacterium]